MLRVLHCVVGMNRGGLETFIMNVYRHIDRKKIQFDFLVSLPGAYDEEIRALGGQIYPVDFIDKQGPWAYAATLRHFFKAHPQYQIVHIHMDKFGGMLAREAEKSGVPVRILHSHSTDNDGNFLVRAVKNHYGKKTGNATHFMACGWQAAQWMFGPGAERAEIIKNGIDLTVFTPEDRRDPSRFTLGHVGRFNAVKNHRFLLDVFAEVLKKDPASRLRLAGNGPLMPQIRQQASALNMANAVEFSGQITDIAGFLQELDVLCMPSLHEGLPVSLVEAQACGVPCLAASMVSPESNITGGVTFLSLDAPPARWAAALLEHKGKAKHDARQALREQGYDINEITGRMEDIYLRMLHTL